ncbi:MAG: type 2 isopentenyl-diphosphate Delta-isomerase [Streptosporangiaceae bacterium]
MTMRGDGQPSVMADVARRKAEHISTALQIGDSAGGSAGWDDVQLVHDALPDTDFGEVDLGIEFLGGHLLLPLLISGMTGGHQDALQVNGVLARAAAATGVMIGVGSQRAALEDPAVVGSYAVVREEAPDAFVLANIGISQLVDQPEGPALQITDILGAIDMVRADALAVHLNYLEEVVQPEGQTRARGAAQALRVLCRELPIPVIAKETGAGLSRDVALRLRDLGVCALDVGGRGGTSFAAIEARRAAAAGDVVRASTGQAFAQWGIPTAASVAMCSDVLPTIAVGGVRNGLDAARALSLGAVAVGVGRPLLEQALLGADAVQDWIAAFAHQLRAAAFLAGVPSVRALPSARSFLRGATRQWLDELAGDVRRGTQHD